MERGSSTKQGYGARWRKLRKMQLAREPYCRDCEREWRVELATDVHHIIKRGEGGKDAFENFMSLCHSHHSRRTARGE